MNRYFFIAAMAFASLAACSAHNPHYDPSKPHHTPEGFRNDYPHAEKGSFWAWQWERWQSGLPLVPPGGWKFAAVNQDPQAFRGNHPEHRVTWIGHATVLVQIGPVNIITDPHFSERASPFGFVGPRRVVPPTPGLAELPHIDAVVISHDHYDHLDIESVKALANQSGGSPRFFVGLGLKEWFAQFGITEVVELDWWQHVDFKGFEIHFAPVQHWSKRTLTDANQRLWGAWVVRHPTFSFFFAGDAGYSQDFADIGRRLGPFDLAAIPIGSYAPRWFMRTMHVNPFESVKVHQDIGARQSLGIHWGTFANLADDPLDEAPRILAEALAANGLSAQDFFVLKHGETRTFARRRE